MKKKNPFLRSLYFLMPLVLMALVFACNKEDVTKDLVVYLRTDVLYNPISIIVEDANPANGPITENLSISITGKDADKIFSVLGERAIKAENNVINIGIPKSYAPTADHPVSFTLKVSAPGYLSAIQNYVITDAQTFRLEQIALVNTSAPPSGVTLTNGTVQVNGEQGTLQDFSLLTAAGNGDSETLGLFIPAGTAMYEEGSTTPLSGNAVVTIVHLSSVNPDAGILFPGGKHTGTQVMAFNGTQKKPARAEPAGCMSMRIEVGGDEATTFSQPLTTTVGINSAISNPEKNNSPVAAGDSLSIWRFDENAGSWNQESRSVIQSDGGLIVHFEHTHLSWWFAGWLPEFDCIFSPWEDIVGDGVQAATSQSTLTVHSAILPDPTCQTGGGYFFTVVRDVKTGMTYYRGYEQYFEGRVIPLHQWIPGAAAEGIRVSIYEGSTCEPGALLFETTLTGLCSDGTLDIGDALPQGLKVSLEVSGSCSGDVEIIPTLPIYYREAIPGSNPCFKLFGYVNKGTGCTGNIFKGKKYDFAVLYGDTRKYLYGITIPEENAVFKVEDTEYGFEDTIEIEYSGDNLDEMRFTFSKIGIPASLCDEFKKFF